jgi:hypothetical protein
MKMILLLTILIVGCGPKSDRFEIYDKKCVVDSIYEVQRSTIEFDKRYSVVTDCGEYPLTTNNLRIKKGDTIIFSRTYIKK